jgi:hypothetical protein
MGCREPVAFQHVDAGDGLEALGHGGLQGHAAGHRAAQGFRRVFREPEFVVQPIEQRIHTGHPGDGVVLEGALEVRNRPRIGDQDVLGPPFVKEQHIRGEGEDVVERQRRENNFRTGTDFPAEEDFGLPHIRYQVGMAEHRALGDARRAAGILQHRQIIGAGIGRVILDLDAPVRAQSRAARERVTEQGMGMADWRQRPVPVALHQADDPAHHARHLFRDRREDDMLDRMDCGGFRQLVGEHVDDDERADTGIRELPPHLRAGIEGIGVDQHEAGLGDAECRDGKGEPVGHLKGDPVASVQP